MNDRDVAQLLAAIDVTWPGAVDRSGAPVELRVRVWSSYLADATIDEAIAAVQTFGLRQDQFPPGPGAVAGVVMDLRQRAAGGSAPAAADAYAEVLDAVRRRGWYVGPPAWSHPTVASIVAAIGWDELCHGDVMVVRAHFLKLYDATVRDAAQRTVAAVVTRSIGGPIRSLDAVLDERPALGSGGQGTT